MHQNTVWRSSRSSPDNPVCIVTISVKRINDIRSAVFYNKHGLHKQRGSCPKLWYTRITKINLRTHSLSFNLCNFKGHIPRSTQEFELFCAHCEERSDINIRREKCNDIGLFIHLCASVSLHLVMCCFYFESKKEF